MAEYFQHVELYAALPSKPIHLANNGILMCALKWPLSKNGWNGIFFGPNLIEL